MEVVADSDIDKNGADNNCVGNDNIGKDDNIAKDDSEKIKNQQNNPEIEDPDFDIGQETASFENDSLKISYKRTKLKKFEHFNLTEYNSSINIALKRDHQSIFMTITRTLRFDSFFDFAKFLQIKKQYTAQVVRRTMYVYAFKP